jgi:hypothetical protein
MKRMELQSFSLKLNELKEYDQAKLDRQDGNTNKDDNQQQPPAEKMITKGPKTKQEIHTRIGLNMNATT